MMQLEAQSEKNLYQELGLGFHDAGIKNYGFFKKSLIVDRPIISPVFSLQEVDFTIPNPANMFQISDYIITFYKIDFFHQ